MFRQGDLNADYARRVEKFLDAYYSRKTPAPGIPHPDPTQPPLFKGYQVTNQPNIKIDLGV